MRTYILLFIVLAATGCSYSSGRLTALDPAFREEGKLSSYELVSSTFGGRRKVELTYRVIYFNRLTIEKLTFRPGIKRETYEIERRIILSYRPVIFGFDVPGYR